MIEHPSELIRQINQVWAQQRLLVVGDVMLDQYVWGDVRRISPEAPVPVVHVKHRSHQAGGAGNVALNIARLGAYAKVIGFTGVDHDSELLTESLTINGVSSKFITSNAFPTISKMRILGARQQMLRLDCESLGERPVEDYERLTDVVLSELADYDAVVLSDYAKGVLTPEVCQTIIDAGRAQGIHVLVDPKNADFSRYRGATTICPNLLELSKAAHLETSELDQLLSAGERMVEDLGLQFLTATLSEKGIAVLRRSNRFTAPAVAREVFDVSGAGDTVIAVLALGLASGLDPEIAVQLANIAAGVVVGKVGTCPIEKHELLAALSPQISLHPQGKVATRNDLAARAAAWKQGGERIVFTNGCFDLLHIGHITLLEQARSFGDRLIVGLNSDESVKRLKKPNRPIVGENERAAVIAALGVVDAVTIFNESTPLELVLAIRPDVIVKGGDYDSAKVIGGKEVESWGGQVRIVPTIEGHSTTTLIRKGQNATATEVTHQ